jgi:putative ABC transport system ATP-binding protein
MAEVLVVLHEVGRVYGHGEAGVVALSGASCQVQAGDRIAVVGPSGSGKSTLLQVMGGLDRPTSGEIRWPALGAVEHLRPGQVGFAFQTQSLLPPLTAVENVELPLLLGAGTTRDARAAALEALRSLDLAEIADKLPEELSGGQVQRVGVARALATRPRLLLADEPTGEVDSATAQSLFDLFHELNRRYGLTIIIVTHDPQIAQRVDRVVAIRDGKTSTETIRQANQLERAMVGERPLDEGTAEGDDVDYHEYVVLDSAGRLQVPKEYLEQTGIGDRATLEMTDDGILIRPVAGRQRVAAAPLLEGLEDEAPTSSQKGLARWWTWARRRPE